MSVVTGDFIGFSFDGHSSSELGIVRVSNGNRYEDNLLPTFQDSTVQVPGGNGTYYFGTYYTQKPIQIQIAFDSLTEVQFRKIQTVFQADKMGKLIFEETPYKYYLVKVSGAPNLKYLCFGEKETIIHEDKPDIITNVNKRIYKGEGTLNFIAYFPFAMTNENKYISDFKEDNVWEWAESSGMLYSASQLNYPDGNAMECDIYNGGDVPTDWSAYFVFPGLTLTDDGTDILKSNLQYIQLKTSDGSDKILNLKDDGIVRKGKDNCFRINSKTNLIEGGICNFKTTNPLTLDFSTFSTTENLYNEYIKSGDFFQIPVDERFDIQDIINNRDLKGKRQKMGSNIKIDKIAYSYRYF